MRTPVNYLSAYRKKIAQLNIAIQMADENFHLGTVTELNNRLTELLIKINADEALLAELAPELRTLYISHQTLMKQCQAVNEDLKEKMTNTQQNKEGLLAYQSAGAQS